jgi:hypothetical protein
MNGDSEARHVTPMRPGDGIRSPTKLVDMHEKTGRLGVMMFLVYETI